MHRIVFISVLSYHLILKPAKRNDEESKPTVPDASQAPTEAAVTPSVPASAAQAKTQGSEPSVPELAGRRGPKKRRSAVAPVSIEPGQQSTIPEQALCVQSTTATGHSTRSDLFVRLAYKGLYAYMAIRLYKHGPR